MFLLAGWLTVAWLLLPVQKLAPYAASAPDVVDRMLTLAGVSDRDVLIDLGCGDGRIPIRAAQKYGARGIGVDIDPRRIEEARANAVQAGVEHLTEFHVGDALAADVSEATVVTLFLGSEGNAKLRPMLRRQLKPGARVVSHAFSMGTEWPPDEIDRFTSRDGDAVTLYLWKISQEVRRSGGRRAATAALPSEKSDKKQKELLLSSPPVKNSFPPALLLATRSGP